MTAGGNVLVLLLGVAIGAVIVATAGTTAVNLDTVALAGDTVALAGASAAVGAGGAVTAGGGGAVGAVGESRSGGRSGRASEVGDDVLVVELSVAEAGGELLKSSLVVLGVEDVLGGSGGHGLGSLDLRNGQWATLGDVDGVGRSLVLGGRVLGRALGGALGGGLGRRLGRRLGGGLGRASGHIEDVQLSASGGLNGGADGWVVGDVVTIDDVVVPVSLASLEG